MKKTRMRYSQYFSVPLICYMIGLVAAILLSVVPIGMDNCGSLLQSIGSSLLASVVFALLTDFGATTRNKQLQEKRYDVLVGRLQAASELVFAYVVADDRQLPPSQRVSRTYSEWVDFFADHFYDEKLYEACALNDVYEALEEIATEANKLKSVVLLRFDHETMDRFSRNRFARIETIATRVLELIDNDDNDAAFKLLRDDFKQAILTVCPNAPLNRKVNCDMDL